MKGIPARLAKNILKAAWRLMRPETALRLLFKGQDILDRLIAERATAYGGGLNPKHRLTGYHDFFVQRVTPEARVLDIGCGVGALARSIAAAHPDARVTGIDMDGRILAQATAMINPPNLTLILSKAEDGLPPGPWDTLVLSNVLEHIERRQAFLQDIIAQACPRQLLIRVPLFERHWHMPLRRELGVDFRSDPTHFIEYTLAEFEQEMEQADLRIVERQLRWGEIWAVSEPRS